MGITVGTLVVGGLDPATAKRVCEDLVIACIRFKIGTAAQQGAFVAQCAVESANFTRLEENLNYTTPQRVLDVFPSRVKSLEQARRLCRNPIGLANLVYANKLGNGDEASGDGHRFIGRGWIQLTGRDNYRQAGLDCNQPFEENPNMVARMPGAWLSAGAFWTRNDCGPLADARDWDGVTRRINGKAMLEREQRKRRSIDFMNAFIG